MAGSSIQVKDLEKQKTQLLTSYKMWEKTIKETERNLKNARVEDGEDKGKKKYTPEQIENTLSLLRNGEQDVIDKWIFLGGTMEELEASVGQTKKVKETKSPAKTVSAKIAEVNDKPKVRKIQPRETGETVIQSESRTDNTRFIPEKEETNPLASYDIIPLPSKGECYPGKQGKIAVSYLTAIDENIIISPNLYRDNMVLDIILKEKIRNEDIDPDDLLDGDRDAIILFLRASAYGNMYNVSTTDPVTKESFETSIDLSKIKYKDFTLKGDENGYFDFELPVSKDKIKFKFLTHKDYVNLAKLDEIEILGLRKSEIERFVKRIEAYLENDDNMTTAERADVNRAVESLRKWADKSPDEEMAYSHRASNELEMEIMSVNGNTDEVFIHQYVEKMPIKDASSLRRYINQNTPGVDYNFEVKKPESLGGGSMKVFLQFDQFIFLTDTE